MERSLITNYLDSLKIDYTIKNKDSILKDFESYEISSNIDYSMNGKNYKNGVQLLFSEKDMNCSCMNIICDNPKYVMYSVLFDLLYTDYFGFEEETIIKTDCNFISDSLNETPKFRIGFNNVIGGKPFSFYRINNKMKRVKSFGRILFGKNIEISNNTVIDSGILSPTIIKDGVIIDSNVYIAHDCSIGENTIITAGVSIGGFSKIGKNCYLGMNSIIKNGLTIGNNVTVGMGTVVTKSFENNVVLVGNPARVLRQK